MKILHAEAFLVLIVMFYLLDTHYARSIKIGFTVLQNLIFQDKNNNPGDLCDGRVYQINEQFVI